MDMIIELGRCNHIGIDYLLRSYFKDFDVDNDDDIDIDEEKYESSYGVDDREHNYFNIHRIKLDLDGIEENRFTPAQIKQICKESYNLENALNTMRNICKAKPESLDIVEEENVDEMKQLETEKLEDLVKLHRSRSLPLYLDDYGPLTLDEAMEIKRLPSGHWIGP